MKTQYTPPGKKQKRAPTEPEDIRGKAPGQPAKKTGQEAGERGEKGVDGGKPSEEEVISTWRNPITNQDEQEKITNAGGDDTPPGNE